MMYKFNNVEDNDKAVLDHKERSREQLIQELCYWRDKYRVEHKQCEWLDLLADSMRDTSDKEMEEASSEAYEVYSLHSGRFNKKWY